MFRQEILNPVDELNRALFNTRGQAGEVVKVEVLGQIALDDRVNTSYGCDDSVPIPLAVPDQFPVPSGRPP